MRRLHASGHSIADHILTVLVRCGYWPAPETKILDYGCGDGSLVYHLRDLGFDAYGFDIHERVNYRSPEDRQFFGFAANPQSDTSNMVIEDFRVPFPCDTFDLVISYSVIEHVMNLSQMMGETARVLKPSGISFHTLPRSSMPIEPHMYMPLGIQFPRWWWFYLWALLGVRNEWQGGMSAREVADRDYQYSQTGVKYLTRAELFEVTGRYFEIVRFVDAELNYAMTRRFRWKNRLRAFSSENRSRAFAETFLNSALLTSHKRAEPRPPVDMRFRKRLVRSVVRRLWRELD